MAVKLIDEQLCLTCGGTKLVPYHRHPELTQECTVCGGTGVRVSPVNCAGCKHWNQGYYCSKTDTFNCEPDHGCTLWTAKEGTDGR